jgi:hypothetical protein
VLVSIELGVSRFFFASQLKLVVERRNHARPTAGDGALHGQAKSSQPGAGRWLSDVANALNARAGRNADEQRLEAVAGFRLRPQCQQLRARLRLGKHKSPKVSLAKRLGPAGVGVGFHNVQEELGNKECAYLAR